MNRWISEYVCGFTRVFECVGVSSRAWMRGYAYSLVRERAAA